jgi:hypothetical protein
MPTIMIELIIAYCIIMAIFGVVYFLKWLYNDYITWPFEQ